MSNADDNNFLIDPGKGDLEYYRVVRMTLHGLDNTRLKAAVSGLSFCSAMIGVAITSWHYNDSIDLFGTTIPIFGYLISVAACYIGVISSSQFKKKIEMFNSFIVSSCDIAEAIEDKIFTDDKYKLTAQFNINPHAGKGGDKLFIKSLNLLKIFALVALSISMLMIISSAYMHLISKCQ